MRRIALALATLGAALIAGCGASAPTGAHTNAVAAIRAAEVAGAGQQPTASLHLALAREAIEAAEAAMEDGRHEQARRSLARAGLGRRRARHRARRARRGP